MPTRLLLIGPGALGRMRARCFRDMPEVTLAGVVSRSVASADRAAADLGIAVAGTSLDAVAERARPDAAVIATVNSEHHRYIVWALQHDLDVFVEGPMVVNSQEAQEIVTLARERGRIVEVGFQRRYHPTIQRARRLIQEGRYGPLVWGEVEFLWHMVPAPGQPDPWYLNPAQSGGMAVCHMSYGLNTLRWVLGNPTRVFASGNSLGLPAERTGVDMLAVTMMYPNGSVANVVANFSAPEGFPTGVMKAHCVSGGFSLQILHGVHGTFWEGEAVEEVTDRERAEGEPEWGADDLCVQCRAFAMALESREGLLNPPEDSLLELRLIESVLRSAEMQAPVDVAG